VSAKEIAKNDNKTNKRIRFIQVTPIEELNQNISKYI
jgi:hypothetical protein